MKHRLIALQPLVLFGLLALGSCEVASAQEFPAAFQGEWLIANDRNNTCKKNGSYDSDGGLRVTKRKMEGWEHSCSLKSITPSPKSDGSSTIVVTLRCGGEGDIYATKEIWSVQYVGVRKALVMTSTEVTERVAYDKKMPTKFRPDIGSHFYLVCG